MKNNELILHRCGSLMNAWYRIPENVRIAVTRRILLENAARYGQVAGYEDDTTSIQTHTLNVQIEKYKVSSPGRLATTTTKNVGLGQIYYGLMIDRETAGRLHFIHIKSLLEAMLSICTSRGLISVSEESRQMQEFLDNEQSWTMCFTAVNTKKTRTEMSIQDLIGIWLKTQPDNEASCIEFLSWATLPHLLEMGGYVPGVSLNYISFLNMEKYYRGRLGTKVHLIADAVALGCESTLKKCFALENLSEEQRYKYARQQRESSARAFDWLMGREFFQVSELKDAMGVSYAGARKMTLRFLEYGLIKENPEIAYQGHSRFNVYEVTKKWWR